MDPAEAAEKIREAIGSKGFLIVIGKMEGSYIGRASSTLEPGDPPHIPTHGSSSNPPHLRPEF